MIKTTDSEGYFVDYLPVDHPPRYYITLAIEHQGLYAKAIPFIMIDDVDLVLKLNGNPGPSTRPTKTHEERYYALEVFLEPPPMWVGNQTNGHAYKITKNQTIKDAMQQAEAEGAYLSLSINDEAEEKWLNRVYGTDSFGLDSVTLRRRVNGNGTAANLLPIQTGSHTNQKKGILKFKIM